MSQAMYTYPLKLRPDDNGTLLVEFPDFPWVHTFGQDEAEALARALDALESGIIAMISQDEAIPAPSKPKRSMRALTLPALSAAKVALYRAMGSDHVTKSELARRLGCPRAAVE